MQIRSRITANPFVTIHPLPKRKREEEKGERMLSRDKDSKERERERNSTANSSPRNLIIVWHRCRGMLYEWYQRLVLFLKWNKYSTRRNWREGRSLGVFHWLDWHKRFFMIYLVDKRLYVSILYMFNIKYPMNNPCNLQLFIGLRLKHFFCIFQVFFKLCSLDLWIDSKN